MSLKNILGIFERIGTGSYYDFLNNPHYDINIDTDLALQVRSKLLEDYPLIKSYLTSKSIIIFVTKFPDRTVDGDVWQNYKSEIKLSHEFIEQFSIDYPEALI